MWLGRTVVGTECDGIGWTMTLPEDLISAFAEKVEHEFGEFQKPIQAAWPAARVAVCETRREDRLSRTISVLHSAAGDAIELQLELYSVGEKLWLEATLYFGQDTAANATVSHWVEGEATSVEVRATVAELVHMMKRRMLRAIELVKASEIT